MKQSRGGGCVSEGGGGIGGVWGGLRRACPARNLAE